MNTLKSLDYEYLDATVWQLQIPIKRTCQMYNKKNTSLKTQMNLQNSYLFTNALLQEKSI